MIKRIVCALVTICCIFALTTYATATPSPTVDWVKFESPVATIKDISALDGEEFTRVAYYIDDIFDGLLIQMWQIEFESDYDEGERIPLTCRTLLICNNDSYKAVFCYVTKSNDIIFYAYNTQCINNVLDIEVPVEFIDNVTGNLYFGIIF